MNIVVNTRLLLPNKLEGIGWVTYEIFSRMVTRHPEHQFFFLFDRAYDSRFIFSSNIKPIVLFPPARHPWLWELYYEIAVPLALKRCKADLFISPDSMICRHTSVPTISVMHDLNFKHYPQWLPKVVEQYYNKHMGTFARKATHLIAVSQFTKEDLINSYGIPSDKITVIHNAANPKYHPLDEQKKQDIRSVYTHGQSYFLFVGSLHPRKNIKRLLQAFDIFKEQDTNNIKMVIVGTPMWKSNKNNLLLQDLKHLDDIVFTGYLSDNELSEVMGAALGLVYVSLFEGFGIPIVEAFHAEVPVITSNVTSMPEVAGNAALLVDPYQTQSIANAMIKLAGDPQLQQDLICKGRQRREFFSWDRSADLFWQVIEQHFLKRNTSNKQTLP